MNVSKLTTESHNPESESLDTLPTLEVVRLMNREDAHVADAVGCIVEPIAKAIDIIADRLAAGGRLIYLGAGTSGRLGVLDASECPPTFNSPPWQVIGLIAGGTTALTRSVEGAEDHPELAVADLQRIDLSSRDVLVGIAASGRTPYVIGGLEHARKIGAYAIGLTCNDAADLSRVSDLTLAPVPGPEILSGSTRLKAGTATKLVLNMLSTGAMVKLGKVYGHLMVDLQTTNAKLTDRAVRIVSALTGLSRDEADELLKRSDGDVKTAFVVHRRGVDLPTARRLLNSTRGSLRDAVEANAASSAPAPPANGRILVLGIDGGGTKTLAWLVDSDGANETPIGTGQSGPSNPLAVGWNAALANIDLAIQRAFTTAGLDRCPVAAACLAIAGTGRETERRRLQTWVAQRHIAERVTITNDALPVLAAGTASGVGIAIIAGTGSFAFGQTEVGTQARAGGWGHILGDDGSGHAIARAGLHAATLAHDGAGPATRLTDSLLKALDVATVMDLRDVVSTDTFDTKRLAALAPLVISAAEEGDSVAELIIDEAAQGLTEMALAVSRQLDNSSETHEGDLALAGSVLTGSDFLRQRLLDKLAAAGFTPTQVELVEDPVRGAIRLAMGSLVVPDETPAVT